MVYQGVGWGTREASISNLRQFSMRAGGACGGAALSTRVAMSEDDNVAAGWYEATRVASPERPRLNFDLDVDVCVIGAGLAGLTVAREVARRGWSVAVLEGGRVARAASGRNTGFVLPGFSEDIESMVERIGLDHTKQLWALSEQGIDYVRRAVAETGMPGVDPIPGWLHVSKTDNSDEIDTEVERLRWIGATVEAWPTQRVREVLPNKRYFGALYFPGAIHIHPLNYALGLAADAEKSGARIFENTQAIGIDPAGVRKRVDTPEARVRAAHVVLACNVQVGDLMPRLGATLLPITTFVLVTEPIPRLAEIVRYRGAVSDTNRADNHYRIVGGADPVERDCSGRAACAPGRPIRAGSGAGSSPISSAIFPISARSRSRICGAARSGARCIACRRSARSRAAYGWRAASAGTGSTPRRWAANWSRAASSRPIRPGGCSRPTNWCGPAACSAGRWRKVSIGARGRSSGSNKAGRATANRRAAAKRRGLPPATGRGPPVAEPPVHAAGLTSPFRQIRRTCSFGPPGRAKVPPL